MSQILLKYRFVLKVLVLNLFLSATVSALAQKYPFKHYDVDKGLPSSDIFHVIQDSKGYIWIATDNGVSKFNGVNFSNYGIADGLPQNTILEIFEDTKGRVWFVSIRSTLAYYENGKIFPYKYNELLEEKLKKRNIPVKYSFYVDSLDNVYLTTESLRMKIIDASGNMKMVSVEKQNVPQNLILDEGNRMIMSFSYKKNVDTLFYIKNNKTIPIYIKDFPEAYIKHYNAIKYGKNKILIAAGNSIYEITNFKQTKIYKFKNRLLWIQKDSKENIWISTDKGGVECFNKGKIKEKADLSLLKDFVVASIFEDSRGGYWFATLHNGVFYLPTLDIQYLDRSNLLLRNNVNLVFAQKDSLWVGYHTNYVTLIHNNKATNFKLSTQSDFEISDIIYDKQVDRIVIGTYKSIYTIKNGKVEKYVIKKADGSSIDYQAVKILTDGHGGYWVVDRAGFFHIRNHHFDFYSSRDKNFALRSNAIYIDNDSTIWLGTVKGLWRFKNNFLDYLGNENPLFSIRILDICNYQNLLTLGTKGGGVLIVRKDTVIQVNKKNGLNSNTITSLTVSGNYLWAATKDGLSKIQLHEDGSVDVSNYTKAHGLLTNEIRHVFAIDSFVYASSNKGVMKINMHKLKKDTMEVPIYFKEVLINNQQVPLQESYHLDYRQNNILIKFEALSYEAPDEIKFRYVMLGLDSICSETKSKELRFSFLPPGNYTLELTASNKDNVWNKNSKKISFTIEKPFWQTNWFISLIVFLLIALIYLFIKIKARQIQNKNEIQRELNIYIKQALVNHMNPHFMFNTLSKVNHLILNDNKEEASEYLSRFSRLMRVIIENSKKEYIPIFEEIKSNRMYLEIEASRMKHKLSYQFIIDDNVDQFKTKVPSLLIHPFIENAIWYGIQPMDKEGKITIKISISDNLLRIEIKDNGIGRKKSMELIKNNEVFNNQSKGTEISYKRVKVLEKIYGKNTKIEYIDLEGEETGTIVILNLPLLN